MFEKCSHHLTPGNIYYKQGLITRTELSSHFLKCTKLHRSVDVMQKRNAVYAEEHHYYALYTNFEKIRESLEFCSRQYKIKVWSTTEVLNRYRPSAVALTFKQFLRKKCIIRFSLL